MLVYVPALDRYVDPAATEMRDSATLDWIIRASAVRAHLIGPALRADLASDVCREVCMSVYAPGHDSNVVGVVTETIRVP
jgi:hypothetical protein